MKTTAKSAQIDRRTRRRQQILARAVDIASAEGLEGLTIGRLASELEMSKSGLFGHFGSKQELQLAAVVYARDVFLQEIIVPAEQRARGLGRLVAYLERWLSYIERSVFRGGCFFAAASAEFDSRPGNVRYLIAELTGAWLRMLEEEIRAAVSAGDLQSGTDAKQLAFELHALVQEANWAFRLLDDAEAFERARRGVRARLRLAGARLETSPDLPAGGI